MSVITETDPAALAGTSRAFSRNQVLVQDEISEVFRAWTRSRSPPW